MAITQANLETLGNAAATAIAGGDYATAANSLRQLGALIAAVPNMAKANASLTWRSPKEAFDAAARLDSISWAAEVATNGMTQKLINRKNPRIEPDNYTDICGGC